jgi:sugar/nucleoside kinase (ribokinase family)
MAIDILFLGGTSIDLIQDKNKQRKNLSFVASVGGGITNSAIISAKLGLRTALLSRIGKDILGDFAVDFLKSCKINIRGIIQDPGIKTPIAIANIDKFGNSRYTFYKNSPKDSIVLLRNAPKVLLNTCRIFHFGSNFSYQKETSEETLKYIKYLKKKGVFISFDPNLRPYNIKDKAAVKKRVLKLLKLANLTKLSEIDLTYLTGQKAPQKALKWLKNRLKCEVTLTLGAKGCVYLDHSRNLIKIPAFKVKIADTIGAGDAFTAGLIYKLIEQGREDFFANIRNNMMFASAISAIICTQKGSHQALRNIKQVNLFLVQNQEKGMHLNET